MNQSDKFRQQVDDFRARVLELQEHAIQTPPIPDLLDELMSELAQTLAELDVAEEELREQGEMLDETRNALVREQQQYQRLFEFAPDAYIVTDLNGSIQRVNLAAVQLLRLEAKFLSHKPLIVFVTDDQHQIFRNAVMNMREAGSVSILELRLYPRGKPEPVSVIATTNLIYEVNGTPSAIHWAFVDITTQKRLEEDLRQINSQLEKRVQERTANLGGSKSAKRRTAGSCASRTCRSREREPP